MTQQPTPLYPRGLVLGAAFPDTEGQLQKKKLGTVLSIILVAYMETTNILIFCSFGSLIWLYNTAML